MTLIISIIIIVSMLIMLFTEGLVSKLAMLVCATAVGANIYAIFSDSTTKEALITLLETPVNPVVGMILLAVGLIAVPIIMIKTRHS